MDLLGSESTQPYICSVTGMLDIAVRRALATKRQICKDAKTNSAVVTALKWVGLVLHYVYTKSVTVRFGFEMIVPFFDESATSSGNDLTEIF